nr:MAG TPA: hypothetical protein [Caudoviricetes sp.]
MVFYTDIFQQLGCFISTFFNIFIPRATIPLSSTIYRVSF